MLQIVISSGAWHMERGGEVKLSEAKRGGCGPCHERKL